MNFAIVLADPGEWPTAGIFLGVAFLVAVTGVMALGIWVVRGDSINRRTEAQAEGETEREQLSPGRVPGAATTGERDRVR